MPQDAIKLLIEDHKKVREMFEELSGTSSGAVKKRESLLAKIEKELQIHTRIEEEIFYPAFRDAGGKEGKKMFYEAIEEHRAVEELVLPDLKNTEPGSEKFSGRCKVLKELVEHHVSEEEKEMFPAAKKALSKQQLSELGEEMMERKKELGA